MTLRNEPFTTGCDRIDERAAARGGRVKTIRADKLEVSFLRRRKKLGGERKLFLKGHDHGIDQELWFSGEGFDGDCGLCKELADSNRGSAELKRDAGTKPDPK